MYGTVGLKNHFREIEENERKAKTSRAHAVSGSKSRLGYVIWAPSFVTYSAGVGCLYRLCHLLRRRGINAFMVGSEEPAPNLEAPLLPLADAQRLCLNGFAALYPETVVGNPLGASTVVRWVLNRPGLLGGEAEYEPGEHVFYYSDVYLPYIRNAVRGKLYMPTIDESIFFCDSPESADAPARTLACYYVGKSTWKEGHFDRDRTFEITREVPSKSELGKLFRASRVLYCFDNSTILIYEALLCGCPVVIIPDGTQTEEDYSRLELGTEGITWGRQPPPHVKVDVHGLKERLRKVQTDFEMQLDQLISKTYKGRTTGSKITP
jgi:hypothetical protein